MSQEIAVIAGDGVGSEVVPAGTAAVDAALVVSGEQPFHWNSFPWNCEYYRQHGRMMPDDALTTLKSHAAIYLGAIGAPDVPDHISGWQLILPIRHTFGQFVNLRPTRLLDGILSPLRSPGRLDLVCIRENTEGEYTDLGGRLFHGSEREVAVQTSLFTREGISRVTDYAFDYARTHGRASVLSATKSNALGYSMTLWDEATAAVAARYPDIGFSKCHVDALAARYVTAPETLDVVVCSNLFGDILSDLGAALAGGLGMAGSANIDPSRKAPSMFEPVHGSAPDIAGRGEANPFAAIWAASMMLDHLGYAEEAGLVMDAIVWAASSPETRTRDVGGSGSTESVSMAVRERILSAA